MSVERKPYPEQLRDLAQAAEDLGYTLVAFDGRSGRFVARQADISVTIESVLLNAYGLPRILRRWPPSEEPPPLPPPNESLIGERWTGF